MNDFLSVLVEEVGEVAKAMQGEGDLKEELIHTASVCVRILEVLK
jgi:NTP pyrophosphatase (non-canonical NTP hydrolase)